MTGISFVFLLLFAAWAARVAGHDLATRKITNASIKNGLILLAAGLFSFAVYTGLGYLGYVQSYMTGYFYPAYAVHLFWTVLAGLLLWYGEVWPAGDAKFFMLVSAALPLANPALKGFPNYLSLVLLINVFVAGALWAVGIVLASGLNILELGDFWKNIRLGVKNKLSELSDRENKLLLAGYLFNVTFLFLLQQLFTREAKGLISYFFSHVEIIYFFVFIMWGKIGVYFKSRRWTHVVSVCYLLYFVIGFLYFRDHMWVMLTNSLNNVLRLSLILFAFRGLVSHLLEKRCLRSLTQAELEPGMVLSDKSARMLKDNPSFDGAFDDCFKDGLTPEQVGLLKDWLGKLDVRDPKVEVVTGRPFALWIFAGAALTLAFNRNVVALLRSL